MTSYSGRHADLYDVFYSDKDYANEAGFIHNIIRSHNRKEFHNILELACGTGSFALELEKFGYDITAIDNSSDMIACAIKKASGAEPSVRFEVQDMRELERPKTPYDAAICLFDSIGFVQTNDALLNVFQGVHNVLRSGGLFIFEFWHAAAMLKNFDPVRIKQWKTPEKTIIRIAETELLIDEQLAEVKYSVYELNNDNTYAFFTETLRNRYFLIQEMAGWLKQNGFLSPKWFAGFSQNEPITEDTWHILAVASRS